MCHPLLVLFTIEWHLSNISPMSALSSSFTGSVFITHHQLEKGEIRSTVPKHQAKPVGGGTNASTCILYFFALTIGAYYVQA